eukprot:14521765-Alexandrium_andersonii.AAC.1
MATGFRDYRAPQAGGPTEAGKVAAGCTTAYSEPSQSERPPADRLRNPSCRKFHDSTRPSPLAYYDVLRRTTPYYA